MMKRLQAVPLLCAALAAGAAQAAGGAECVLAMATTETEARVAFETGLAELVEGVAPEQAEVAGMSRDVQVLLAEDRLDRVAHLAETRPAAFEGETGAIDWTEADEAAYMADPGHVARMQQVQALGETLENHPDLPVLKDIFANVVTRLFEFQKLMVDHNAARRAAADAFRDCQSG